MFTGPEAEAAVVSFVTGIDCCGRGLWMLAPELAK